MNRGMLLATALTVAFGLLMGCGASPQAYNGVPRNMAQRPEERPDEAHAPQITLRKDRAEPPAEDPVKQVKVGGGRVAADLLRLQMGGEVLRGKVQAALNKKDEVRARHMVRLFPEAARELLLSPAGDPSYAVARTFIARCYDASFAGREGIGFAAIEIARTQGEVWVARFDADRGALLAALESGKAGEAVKAAEAAIARLPGKALLLQAELQKLRGAACLLVNDAPAALQAFGESRRLSAEHVHGEAEYTLLLTEAARRAGVQDIAEEAWLAAVRLLPRAKDPVLWEHATELQPAAIKSVAGLDLKRFSMDAWRVIGEMRLDRKEWQAALLAFSRVESQAATALERAWAQVGQGEALLAMNQRGPAEALLAQVSVWDEWPASAQACALLGACRFKHGDMGNAVRFFKRALARHADHLRNRTGVEADLALAHLASGEEEAGLRLLHQTQKRMIENRDLSGLRASWMNEKRYYRHLGREGDLQELDRRVGETMALMRRKELP